MCSKISLIWDRRLAHLHVPFPVALATGAWLRACTCQIVIGGFAAAAAPPASAAEAGQAAALILAREDAGILETAEAEPVAEAIAAAIGEGSSDLDGLAQCLADLALACVHFGDFDAAHAAIEEDTAISREIGAQSAESMHHHAHGVLHLARGVYGLAAREFQAGQQIGMWRSPWAARRVFSSASSGPSRVTPGRGGASDERLGDRVSQSSMWTSARATSRLSHSKMGVPATKLFL
jgi:hypothetical protein